MHRHTEVLSTKRQLTKQKVDEIVNSNSTFKRLISVKKTGSKAHHTKTLFNIHKPETLQGSAPRKKREVVGNLGWICFSKEI